MDGDVNHNGGRDSAIKTQGRGSERAESSDDQDLCDLLENPADITRASVPVLSSAALSFLLRLDPGFASLFHNLEPWEPLSEGAERGTPTGSSLRSAGVSGAEREVLLVWVARVGMGVLLGGL